MAEYHYFSGQAGAAAQEAEAYLTHSDMGARLSACLIYAYASLSLGEISRARFALGELRAFLSAAGEQLSQFRAASAFVASAAAVLLHLPLPEQMPDVESFLPLLPPGLRAFALYVQAHYLYLKEEYGPSAGMVEASHCHGGGQLPHSCNLPAFGCGDGLHEPEKAGPGAGPSAGGVEDCPSRMT